MSGAKVQNFILVKSGYYFISCLTILSEFNILFLSFLLELWRANMKLSTKITVGLVLGIIFGIILNLFFPQFVPKLDQYVLTPVGKAFLNVIQFVVCLVIVIIVTDFSDWNCCILSQLLISDCIAKYLCRNLHISSILSYVLLIHQLR